MKPTKWLALGIGLLLFFSFIAVVLIFVNSSKGNVSKSNTQNQALNKQTADDDLKPYAGTLLSGQGLLDAKASLTAANRKVNFFYVNIGGSGVIPLYISPNGALPYNIPTGVVAPTMPTNLQAVPGPSPSIPSASQVTNTMTTTSPDYIDPNTLYKTVVYTDTNTNSIVAILAVQQQ